MESNSNRSRILINDSELIPLIGELATIYRTRVRPLEEHYNFAGFHSPPLYDADLAAKPMVLLLGQYSTGKTTFIRRLLGQAYLGDHIGVEPTTDKFVAVMHGSEERIIPGNAAAVDTELPFRALNRFGQQFLSRFQVSQSPVQALQNFTLIDSPGILAGDKQINRGYDFHAAIEWFVDRSDLILLFFDGYKLDVSNEFKQAILGLRGYEEKVRVILNKCDLVPQQQLMRIYGALMWSLGKVVQTPEVMRVYLVSFWAEKPPHCYEEARELLDKEQVDLLQDLKDLPRNALVRKISDIVKRARIAKVHAHIIGHLKKEMPTMFGKKSKQAELIAKLDQVFVKVQQKHSLAPGDFPNVERYKQNLRSYDLHKFNSLKPSLIERVDEALNTDIPRLLRRLPHSEAEERQMLGQAGSPAIDPAPPPPGYSQQ
ncbi:uncharacterized protein VTP21DRAFT_6760 [Calcarisporiella thermophila]|uniref:uncharacterized protein n=1 Tax=Calcarisporiella thermophila TaxID=911321 RepID=UPI00374437C0